MMRYFVHVANNQHINWDERTGVVWFINSNRPADTGKIDANQVALLVQQKLWIQTDRMGLPLDRSLVATQEPKKAPLPITPKTRKDPFADYKVIEPPKEDRKEDHGTPGFPVADIKSNGSVPKYNGE